MVEVEITAQVGKRHAGQELHGMNIAQSLTPACLNIEVWRKSTPTEVLEFFDTKYSDKYGWTLNISQDFI